MGRGGRPEVVDFARNYNPASESLQFADVAKISRHNDRGSLYEYANTPRLRPGRYVLFKRTHPP